MIMSVVKEQQTLELENVRLSSLLEESESKRHLLDLDVARIRRDLAQAQYQISEAQNIRQTSEAALRAQLERSNTEVSELTQQLQSKTAWSKNREATLVASLDEKHSDLIAAALEIEKLKLKVKQLDDSNSQLHTELASKNEWLAQREDENSAMEKKINSLVEVLDTERSNISGLRDTSSKLEAKVTDLESECARKQTVIEQLQSQRIDVEHKYLEEQRSKSDVEYSAQRKQNELTLQIENLQDQLERKSDVVNGLSTQISAHETNFAELKRQLELAKTRQALLEETYGVSIRELEQLCDPLVSGGSGDQPACRPLDPAAVAARVKTALSESRATINSQFSQIAASTRVETKLREKLSLLQQEISSKDFRITDLQDSITRNGTALDQARADLKQAKAETVAYREEAENMARMLDAERARSVSDKQELAQCLSDIRAEEQERVAFLGKICAILTADSHDEIGFKHNNLLPLSPSNWDNAVSRVNEVLFSVKKQREGFEQKIVDLTNEVDDLKRLTASLKDDYDSELKEVKQRFLAAENEQKSAQSSIQRQFEQKSSEFAGKFQQQSAELQQVWEKLRVASTVNRALEERCASFQTIIDESSRENSAYLGAVASLLSFVYHALAQNRKLCAQTTILKKLLSLHESSVNQARMIVRTISGDETISHDSTFLNLQHSLGYPPRRHGVLVFRSVAIALIAANRLSKYRSRLSSHLSMSEHILSNALRSADSCHSITALLSDSKHLRNSVTRSVTELTDVVQHIAESKTALDSRVILAAAKNAIPALLHSTILPNTNTQTIQLQNSRISCSSTRCSKQKPCLLIESLELGLERSLGDITLPSKIHLVSLQHLLTIMHQRLLDCAQKLYDSESNKENLLRELATSEKSFADQNAAKNRELLSLQKQLENHVDKRKFKSVCSELQAAIQRERELESVLRAQSEQAQKISQQLQKYSCQDETLRDTIKGLTNARSEIQQKDGEVRDLNRTLHKLRQEYDNLLNRISEFERAEHQSRDCTDCLLQYMRSVEDTLHQGKQLVSLDPVLSEKRLTTALLSSDHIPSNLNELASRKASTELLACQSLVGAFAGVYRQICSRLIFLQEQLDAHKRHVSSLVSERRDLMFSRSPTGSIGRSRQDPNAFTPL